VARNCLRALRIAILAAIVLSMTAQAAFAYSSYKGFYGGYCASYAARQFDKAAPSPGINWRGNAKTWYSHASARGWRVTRRTDLAVPGSVIVWNDHHSGHVGVVRRVTARYVYGQEMNWCGFGRVNSFKVRRGHLDRGSYKFTGFVLPEREKKS
jgi:surface antigen